MTDPIDRRATRAAASIHSATSESKAPPINVIARRAATDRVLGVGLIAVTLTGLITVAALAGTGGTDDVAGPAPSSSTTTTTTTPSATSLTTVAPTTTVLDGLERFWRGSGGLLIELLGPDDSVAFAVADLLEGERALLHIQDEAARMDLRIRISGTDAREVLVSGVPIEVGGDGVWSHELEVTLFASDGTVIVLEVDGIAYGVEIVLGADQPSEAEIESTTTTVLDAPTTLAPTTTTTLGNDTSTTTATTTAPTTTTTMTGPTTTTTTQPGDGGTTTTVTTTAPTTTTTMTGPTTTTTP